MAPNMIENKSSKKGADNSNNNTVKKEESETVFENLPTTITYHSTYLPDAIFLTTSNGQLITTSTMNYSTFLSTDMTSTALNTSKVEKQAEGCAAAKPSAIHRKSSAQLSKEQTLLKFPFLATSSNLVTGFALPSPLIAPNLTIPIYNSLITVPATKETPTSKTAQAKSKSTIATTIPDAMTTSRGRKRTAQSRLPAKLKEPAAVARRNARERRRVKMVNDGFLRLRRHVPTDPKNKKLSKVKTLRLAIEYIHHLQQLLQSDANSQQSLQLVANISHVTAFDDADSGNAWLNGDHVGRVTREMDEDIFQPIDPSRLRTTYTDYITR